MKDPNETNNGLEQFHINANENLGSLLIYTINILFENSKGDNRKLKLLQALPPKLDVHS